MNLSPTAATPRTGTQRTGRRRWQPRSRLLAAARDAGPALTLGLPLEAQPAQLAARTA